MGPDKAMAAKPGREAEGLYARHAGQGPAVILLHGLFGSGANLGMLARSLRESFLVYNPDLPSHGRSCWLSEPDLTTMADVLFRWMTDEGPAHAHLVGHSLGGKVAMQLALDHPDRVDSLVVADIAPVAYPPRHDGVFDALVAVDNARCETREEAAEAMGLHIEDERVIQFLLTSLQRTDDGTLAWRFDLQGIAAGYPELLAAPAGDRAFAGPVLFIKGGESDYIRDAHRERITAFFPAATLKVMPGCGHWLHAEQPQLFNRIVARFLADAVEQSV